MSQMSDSNLQTTQSLLRVTTGAASIVYLLGAMVNVFFGGDYLHFILGIFMALGAFIVFSAEFSPHLLAILYNYFPGLVEYSGRGAVMLVFGLLGVANTMGFITQISAWVLIVCAIVSFLLQSTSKEAENSNERLLHPEGSHDLEGGMHNLPNHDYAK